MTLTILYLYILYVVNTDSNNMPLCLSYTNNTYTLSIYKISNMTHLILSTITIGNN